MRPIVETSTRGCGPIYKISHVTAGSNENLTHSLSLSLSLSLPALAPARSSFTPRERDHKRTSGPPGAPRWEFNGELFRSLGDDSDVCVYKNLSGVHLCFGSFEATDYCSQCSLGSKGRQPRSQGFYRRISRRLAIREATREPITFGDVILNQQ